MTIKKQPNRYSLDITAFEGLKENIEDLMCIKCLNNAMEPLIKKGDDVIISKAKINIVNNKIYAIWYQNEQQIRHLSKDNDGNIIIRSNKRKIYPDEKIASDELQDQMIIIGQAVLHFARH